MKKRTTSGRILQHVADGEEVAQRLRHLLVVDAHEAVVHPVVDEGVLVRAFGLGDLVLVVRELQVLTAAVDVEMLAQQVAGHGRALDVPARTATAPGRIPLGFVRLARLGGFQSTKSSGSRLPVLTSTRSPARRSSSDLPDSLP
jgi:DNA-binding LytR/AlgR family response regulator